MQVAGRARIDGAVAAPVPDATRCGAGDGWCEILLGDEVVASMPSGLRGDGGPTLLANQRGRPAGAAQAMAKCTDTDIVAAPLGGNPTTQARYRSQRTRGMRGLRVREAGWRRWHRRALTTQ